MKHLILAGSMFFLIATTAVAGDWRQDAVNQDEDFSTIWAEDSVTTASVTEVSEFSALEGIEQSIHWRERALDYDEDFYTIWAEDSVAAVSVTEVSEFSALEGSERSTDWRERDLDYDEDFSSIWTTL